MRIVAGSRRGIPLKSLPGLGTRPTSDKVKESVFNMIGPYFDGGIAIELFGGSGSLSLETLSRGAEEAFIFEKNVKACEVIRANAEKCRFTDQVHIQRTDARNAVNILKGSGKKADFCLSILRMQSQNSMDWQGTLSRQTCYLRMQLLFASMRKNWNCQILMVIFKK